MQFMLTIFSVAFFFFFLSDCTEMEIYAFITFMTSAGRSQLM